MPDYPVPREYPNMCIDYHRLGEMLFEQLNAATQPIAGVDVQAVNELLARYYDRINVQYIPASRFGSLGYPIDEYLRALKVKQENNPREIDILAVPFHESGGVPFAPDCVVANRQLLKMVMRKVPVICNVYFLELVQRLTQHSPQLWNFKYYDSSYNILNIFVDPELFEKVPSQLEMTAGEIVQGITFLKNRGISPNAKFITVSNRDSGWVRNTLVKSGVYSNRQIDTGVGNFYTDEFDGDRDSNINTTLKALNYLTDKGYYIFRLGRFQHAPLDTDNPKIIDFVRHDKEYELEEVYLRAHSAYSIATPSGVSDTDAAFNKKQVFVNMINIKAVPIIRGSLYIFKKLWHAGEKRFITMSERHRHGMINFRFLDFRKAGIEIIENTEDEILDLVVEMEGRLDGTWADSGEDELLQAEFKKMLKGYPSHAYPSSIGTRYLRENADWLLS